MSEQAIDRYPHHVPKRDVAVKSMRSSSSNSRPVQYDTAAGAWEEVWFGTGY